LIFILLKLRIAVIYLSTVLDVKYSALDAATKDAKGTPVRGPGSPPGNAGGDSPVGNFGWMPDISTNTSYLGVRGFQRIPTQSFNFVYQFEAGIDISAAAGTKQSNSNLSNQVNGALFSRNSFIGLASPGAGRALF
jgi:hypothetical protein